MLSFSTLALAVNTTPGYSLLFPCRKGWQQLSSHRQLILVSWKGKKWKEVERMGTLPPDSVMRSQFLSSLSRTAMRVVQILQRPKWAASQVSLWCSRCGLSKAQWSVTTATMASTPPTRMKKRVTRTFHVLVCGMVVTEVWVLWAGGSSVSQGEATAG